MGIFKRFNKTKENLDTQMSNNKLLNEHNMKLRKENIEYQEISNDLKLQVAQLKAEIADLKGFRKQDEEVIKELKKERTVLRRKITILEKKGE